MRSPEVAYSRREHPKETLPSVRSYSRILDRAEKAGQEKTLAYFPVSSVTKKKKLGNID